MCTLETMFSARLTNGFDDWRTSNKNTFGNTFTITELVASYVGINDYWGDCDDGYICEEGATSKQPVDLANDGGYPCDPGFYCPTGTTIQIPCEPGTYNPDPRAAICLQCPAGKYCNDFEMTTPIDCDNAYYCTGLSPADGVSVEGNIFGMPCPAGTYGDKLGVKPLGRESASECEICPDKNYCGEVGLTESSGICARGYQCITGSDRPGPYVTQYEPLVQSGYCKAGTYCQYGQDQIDCAATNYTISGMQSQCLACPPGHFCNGGTHIEQCSSGYYCNEKSDIPSPTDDVKGNICPASHFCERGFGQPIKC
jgi:hypothetical protein